MKQKYVPPRVAVARYGLSRSTLAGWAKRGRIRSLRLGSREKAAHRYHDGDLRKLLGLDSEEAGRRVVAYARVSSAKQKEAGDLERQCEALRQYRTDIAKIYRDVGSGLNFKRKGLLALLDEVERGHVEAVVVTYRDRLARFGTELLERTFRKHGTALDLVFRNEEEERGSGQRELADDLLAVCNFFVATNNGRRAAAMSRRRHERTLAAAAHDQEDAQRGNQDNGSACTHGQD
jgi:putative resolvase